MTEYAIRCRSGRHARTVANTRYEVTGHRRCRDCRAEQAGRAPKGGRLSPRTTLPERMAFYAPPGDPGECWEWQGAFNSNGRPIIQWQGSARYAHRMAVEVATGEPIPDGMFACHHCDNRRCVNPNHLYVGSHLDNMADMSRRGRARNRHTGPMEAVA